MQRSAIDKRIVAHVACPRCHAALGQPCKDVELHHVERVYERIRRLEGHCRELDRFRKNVEAALEWLRGKRTVIETGGE